MKFIENTNFIKTCEGCIFKKYTEEVHERIRRDREFAKYKFIFFIIFSIIIKHLSLHNA